MDCAKCGRPLGSRAKRCFHCGSVVDGPGPRPNAISAPLPHEGSRIKASVELIFIELRVASQPSLFVLLAADGTVNRMGSGKFDNTDLAMFVGHGLFHGGPHGPRIESHLRHRQALAPFRHQFSFELVLMGDSNGEV